MSERTMLMRLVEEAETVEPDWQDALRRAGFAARHRPRLAARRVLVLAVVLVGVLYAVAAIAADEPGWRIRYWLFDRSPETYPTTQAATVGAWSRAERVDGLVSTDEGYVPNVVTLPVLHGEVVGRRFEVKAFFREWAFGQDHLCIGFEPGGTPKPWHGTNVPAVGGSSCGAPMHGLRPQGESDLHWVGATVHVPGPIEPTGGGTGPKYLFGPAAPNVRHVDLESRDGTVVRVATFAGPPDLGVRVRLWVAVLRLDHLVHTIVPRDDEGEALEHWHLPSAY
jgi:hypothetical protein